MMLLFEGILTWGLWIRKAVECLKFCIMSHSSRNMEDSGAEYDLNCGFLDQEVPEEKILVCGLEIILCYFGEESGCFLALSEESA